MRSADTQGVAGIGEGWGGQGEGIVASSDFDFLAGGGEGSVLSYELLVEVEFVGGAEVEGDDVAFGEGSWRFSREGDFDFEVGGKELGDALVGREGVVLLDGMLGFGDGFAGVGGACVDFDAVEAEVRVVGA